MFKKLIFITVFLSFALPVSAGSFKVTRVYDGDTFKAIGHDIETKSAKNKLNSHTMKAK